MTDIQVFESKNHVSCIWKPFQVQRDSRIWILEQAGLPSLGQVISVVEDLAVRAWADQRIRGDPWAEFSSGLEAEVNWWPCCWCSALEGWGWLLPREASPSPYLQCLFLWRERGSLTSPADQGASLIRIAILILVRAIYLRLLPSFVNCFLFPGEPKKKWYCQLEL